MCFFEPNVIKKFGDLSMRPTKASSRHRAIEQLLLANALTISAVAVHSFGTVPRQRCQFPRKSRWSQNTLSQLGEANFRRFFCASQATYRYIMDACRANLQRQDTVMTDASSVKKRVGIVLFWLCSTAEDWTIGELFGVGRSTVNMIYEVFSVAVLV
ncbi:hypothetical protein HPB49_022833 [Dermacentor silvarum]|uniref:Uncharacterized protein n=1 Tax=Dermacentor silvarum TaxID=543639 RepID=A0ACB8DRL9_DERSI|nr:hypothetical protein HPB49_022833 [Dermacentor silvarum]